MSKEVTSDIEPLVAKIEYLQKSMIFLIFAVLLLFGYLIVFAFYSSPSAVQFWGVLFFIVLLIFLIFAYDYATGKK